MISGDVAAQSSLGANILEAATYTGTIYPFVLKPIETTTISLSPSEASLLSKYHEIETALAYTNTTATAQTMFSASIDTKVAGTSS